MEFVKPLKNGRLLKRYKRFLADVECDDGQFTAHCPNTGSMLGCCTPGAEVWLSHSDNPKRKYAWTWELVRLASGVLVGVHTGRSNDLIREALAQELIPELAAYRAVRREISIPGAHGRFDWLLERPGPQGVERCLLEVKNVSAAVQDGVAVFPDAVSERATRHARELTRLHNEGVKTALVFCVQREDVAQIMPAIAIDPVYATALSEAVAAGVTVAGVRCAVSTQGIYPQCALPVTLPTNPR
jgi:sugar fermentation stimulation protein A